MHQRLIKSALVLALGGFTAIIAINNLTHYDMNFRFVQHVMSMDTVFPAFRDSTRAITDEKLHHLSYQLIISIELAVAFLCTLSGILMCKNIRKPDHYRSAKTLALYGLSGGFGLWFVGFMLVGGEWFMMWQSKFWNGQQAAFRISLIMLLALIFIAQPEEKTE